MSNYIDQFGRYHDKPVTETNMIPCNNAWVYSAYAKKIGLPVNIDDDYANDCAKNFTRHKDDYSPPFSRDEVLGMVYLGCMSSIAVTWYFSKTPCPPFNLVETIKQLWASRKDRNYFWLNNCTQVYRFAFAVPLQDRDFIQREIYGKSSNMFYKLIAFIDSKTKPSSDSASLIRWLKYDILPDAEVFARYFGGGHAITVKRLELDDQPQA